MTTYLIIEKGLGMPESQELANKMTKDWNTWIEKNKASMAFEGSPVLPLAKHISAQGKVSDLQAYPSVGGYTLIKAKSLDEAVKIASSSPIFKYGGESSVYEAFDPTTFQLPR